MKEEMVNSREIKKKKQKTKNPESRTKDHF